MMICENETMQGCGPIDDEEVNCVFCGHMFVSIDAVQIHISEVHEAGPTFQDRVPVIKSESVLAEPIQTVPYFSQSISSPEKLTVFDAVMNTVVLDQIRLDQVKLCTRCNRHFVNEEALSLHQLWEHAIRKRKRTSHPNCVEGIVVTIDGTWVCDVCTRKFATLKQAKVHKFKSHIEPAQKQEMLSTEFTRRSSNVEDASVVGQQYRQILPNVSPPLSVESKPDLGTNDVMNLSQSPSPPIIVKYESVEPSWKVKISDSNETRISFSKILEHNLAPKEEHSQKNSAFFAYNPSTSLYSCSHCPAMFSSRAVYSRHILVHRRGKAFVCDSCGMAFTRNHTLKQHKDAKCVIANPVVGSNCQSSDKCPKCDLYFASSNSHLSHCKKICKVIFGNPLEESTRDSVKSEDTNPQCDGQLEIDLEDGAGLCGVFISDFINNPSFVTKRTNEFNCNLCSCYFPSFKSIGQHLEQYHRIKKVGDSAPTTARVSPLETMLPRTHVDCWGNIGTPTNGVAMSPPHKMLTPTNFTLLPIIAMTGTNEVLNLSASSSANANRVPTLAPHHFKPRVIRKVKAQPNANGEFECTECHKSFGCRSSLSNHIKSHFSLKNRPFTCPHCSEGFMSNVSFEEHLHSLCLAVHGPATEKSPSPVIYSGSSPASSRSTNCVHCNVTFPDKSLLDEHAAREHINEHGEVQCISCTRTFTTYMAFRVHMTKAHGGPNGTPLKNSLNMGLSQPYLSLFPSLPISTSSPVVQRYRCHNCHADFVNAQILDNHKTSCTVTSVRDSVLRHGAPPCLALIAPHPSPPVSTITSPTKYNQDLLNPPLQNSHKGTCVSTPSFDASSSCTNQFMQQ